MPELRLVEVQAIDIQRRPARRFLGDIAALAESMQDYGLQQPISVRADGERFVLTSGLRRLHAARVLGWPTILAFVRTVSADEAYLLDMIENLQREDLSAEEEADALGQLMRTRGWTLHQVAHAVKRSVAYISKRVRVFEDPSLRSAVVGRGLAVSTAEEMLGADPEVRAVLIERAVAERWDQARAREAVRAGEASQFALDERSPPAVSLEGGRPRGGDIVVGTIAEKEFSRPPGLTGAVREFHRLITAVAPEDLTVADRSALRSLFRDLVTLARASSTPGPRTFPPLPQRSSTRK